MQHLVQHATQIYTAALSMRHVEKTLERATVNFSIYIFFFFLYIIFLENLHLKHLVVKFLINCPATNYKDAAAGIKNKHIKRDSTAICYQLTLL